MRNRGLLLLVVCSSLAWTQSADEVRNVLSIRPSDRVVAPVAEKERVVLKEQVHPMARTEYAAGRAAGSLLLRRMTMVLRPDAAQDAALAELIRAQHDPESPYFHHWLTPEQFGKRFGVSQHDLDAVIAWLGKSGFEVEEIPASHRTLVFSGTAAQVESAFHTNIQRYVVNGKLHYANANDPEVPAALAPVIEGVVALHDFHSTPMHVKASYTAANGTHYLMPQDWVTIYDVGPVYNQGLDGTGQSIAVLGRVDIALSDVRTFRTNAGLPANDPVIITNGPDPGFPWCDDELESALDVEWAGAIARNATVKFVTSQSTGFADGVVLSAQYAVNNNVAPVISLSYGLCEAAMGASGNAFWNATWAQAAAQGQSVFVSSGDSGAAGCDSPNLTSGKLGRGVNGLCSSPYSTCVGGTQFDDVFNSGQYWSDTNGSGQASALSYIPELAWNESAWSGGLWAGGGGASIIYSKPPWQAGPGVPADGMRDVPDVALHGSIMDAYIVQIQGQTFYVSGTSAATPSLASVVALLLENAGGAQGNVNPVLYALANQQFAAGGAAVFHDVAGGNNSVPGVSGFSAGTGYDEATGLGSVDASLLVNHWSDGTSTNYTLSANPTSVTVGLGGSGTVSVAVTAQGGFNAPVTLSTSGVPSGVTVKFSAATASAGAPVTATFTAAANAVAGNATIAINGSGGGLARSSTVALTVAAPSFSLSTSAASLTLTAGTPSKVTVTSATLGGFKGAVSLSATGLPKGVTASFSPTSIASPGNGSSTLTLRAATTATEGPATVTVKGVSGSQTKTQTISLVVVVPTFAITANSASGSVTAGGSSTFTLNAVGINGFNAAVALSVSGLPSGVTAKFSPTSISSPGTGSSTLTVTAAATKTAGVYTLTVTGTGGGITKTQALSLRVSGPDLTLSLAGTQVVLSRGGSIPLSVTTTGVNGFKAAVTLSVTGLPTGVTATFAPTSIASPGTGSSTLTLKAASSAALKTSTLTVTASGGGATRTQTVSLKVQ